MPFSREQVKNAYLKLSPEVYDFVTSNDTTELISNYLTNSGIVMNTLDSADSEIFYATLGLQTLSDAISNIAQMSGKSVDELSGLKEKLDEEIFSKIAEFESLSKETEPKEPENANEKPVLPQNKVGESFEQIILNQARAMQPARPANETGRSMNYESGIMVENKNIPENLPTENKPHDTHNYPKGEDPYREPLE